MMMNIDFSLMDDEQTRQWSVDTEIAMDYYAEYLELPDWYINKYKQFEERNDTYNIVCRYCGDKGERVIENMQPGMLFGAQCKGCGRVLIAEYVGKTKHQRTKTRAIQEAILWVFANNNPTLTVRQIYYALTVAGAVPKTEAGYRQTCYQLKIMRQNEIIPYGWIADNTRWHIKPDTYTGLDSALKRMQDYYRRDLWARQDTHVEIWIEKDALAGVVSPVTQKYDVPLYVARGYSSMTFIHDAAEELKAIGKPSYVYHFGDYDPSGVDAAYKIRDGLREHGAQISFERVAITEQQITEYNLPARPTKRRDPRAKSWGDKPSVELDAMPAPILRKLVSECIEKHIDQEALSWELAIEKQERASLAAMRENLV